MALVICSECGQKVSDKAKVCPQCGAPIEATVSDEFGTLHVQWKGKWMLTDTSVDLYVNNQLIGKYSFKDGFAVDIPIPSANTEVSVKSGFRTAKHTFVFEPHQDYTCNIAYSRFTGGLGFETTDKEGNVVSDNLSLYISILAFISPLFGVGFGLYVKKDKPVACNTAIITAVCGFLLGLLLLLFTEFPFFISLVASIGFGGGIGTFLAIIFLLSDIANLL